MRSIKNVFLENQKIIDDFSIPIADIFIIILSFSLFKLITFGDGPSDMRGHILFVIDSLNGHRPPPHFLYHLTVAAFAMGSSQEEILMGASIAVLILSVLIKMRLSFSFLFTETGNTQIAALFAFILSISVMPIFNWWQFPSVHLGQLSPNVWHNPTTIFVMPLAILLFFSAVKSLDTFRTRDFVIVSILVTINLLAKPNYFLAFAPVYAIILCYRSFLLRRKEDITGVTIIKNMLILAIPALVVLTMQFLYTYETSDSKIIFVPLKVWKIFSPNIPASLFLSISFPLIFTLSYFRQAMFNTKVVLSWSILIVAILQFALLAEEGPRFAHGNFYWGIVPALFLLFLTCIAVFFKQKFSWKYPFPLVLLVLHIASGSFYFYRYLFFKTWY